MRHVVNLTSDSVLKQTIISLARAKREQIYPKKTNFELPPIVCIYYRFPQ